MIRKLLAAAALIAVATHAFAAIDVNTANEDALRGIKGIGPARAKAIVDERSAHGPFKDTAELGQRVKGLGGHTIERLQAEGLSVGPAATVATAAAPAPAPATSAAPARQAAAPAKTPASPAPSVTVKK